MSDGLYYRAGCGNPFTVEYGIKWNGYDILAPSWTEYELDISNVIGRHIVSFVGGYFDISGNLSSSTSYSNIRFIP